MANKQLWLGIVSLLVIAVIIVAVKKAPKTSTENFEVENKANQKEVALEVADQYAGDIVKILHVASGKPAIVVIQRVNYQGVPSDILGNSELVSNQANNLNINLESKIAEGDLLIATLYYDNNDGIFNFTNDTPAKDKDGNFISKSFKIIELIRPEEATSSGSQFLPRDLQPKF